MADLFRAFHVGLRDVRHTSDSSGDSIDSPPHHASATAWRSADLDSSWPRIASSIVSQRILNVPNTDQCLRRGKVRFLVLAPSVYDDNAQEREVPRVRKYFETLQCNHHLGPPSMA